MDKEKLKQMIDLVIELNGSLTLSYIPPYKIETPEEAYGIYYSGWNRIEISKNYYMVAGRSGEIKDIGIEKLVDNVYELLDTCVGNCIMKALDNFDLDAEVLKYFDRDEDLYNKFKTEVKRLKSQN